MFHFISTIILIFSQLVKPKFTVKPQNTTVFEGQSLLVDCEAYGDPEPVITWIKDEGKVRKTIKTNNNSLYLPEVKEKDAGKYTCYAGSKGGLNTTDFYLTVERKHFALNTTTQYLIKLCSKE